MGDPTRCALCGATLTPDCDWASINGDRYCHPDWEPSCYVSAQATLGIGRFFPDAETFLASFDES
jgi:hypothetical protein